MKMKLKKLEIQTRKERELIDVTDEVDAAVKESGVKDGMVFILTTHTSSGIVVTEGLPCLEEDVLDALEKLAPDEGDYMHNRYLDIDGRIAYNAGSHLKSVLTGYNAFFPVEGGKVVRGSRQRVYFAEFDGPLCRTWIVRTMGE